MHRKRAQQAAANKRYRQRHPEKVAAEKKRYRQKHPEKITATTKIYRRKHIEKYAAASKRWRQRHPEKSVAAAKRYRQKHPEKAKVYTRTSHLRRKYGITIADFNALLALQNHQCAVCGCEFGDGKKKAHIDHDHATGRVRGLVCVRCNTSIGGLGDDVLGVSRALAYLVGPVAGVGAGLV